MVGREDEGGLQMDRRKDRGGGRKRRRRPKKKPKKNKNKNKNTKKTKQEQQAPKEKEKYEKRKTNKGTYKKQNETRSEEGQPAALAVFCGADALSRMMLHLARYSAAHLSFFLFAPETENRTWIAPLLAQSQPVASVLQDWLAEMGAVVM